MSSRKKLLCFSSMLLITLLGCHKKEEVPQEQEKQEVVVQEVKKRVYQDGIYQLEEMDYNPEGWRAVFTIRIEEGIIVDSDFDYVSAQGQRQSEDTDYHELMEDKVGYGPLDIIPYLNTMLINHQSLDQVAVLDGAVEITQQFKQYGEALLNAAERGDTTLIRR